LSETWNDQSNGNQLDEGKGSDEAHDGRQEFHECVEIYSKGHEVEEVSQPTTDDKQGEENVNPGEWKIPSFGENVKQRDRDAEIGKGDDQVRSPRDNESPTRKGQM